MTCWLMPNLCWFEQCTQSEFLKEPDKNSRHVPHKRFKTMFTIRASQNRHKSWSLSGVLRLVPVLQNFDEKTHLKLLLGRTKKKLETCPLQKLHFYTSNTMNWKKLEKNVIEWCAFVLLGFDQFWASWQVVQIFWRTSFSTSASIHYEEERWFLW